MKEYHGARIAGREELGGLLARQVERTLHHEVAHHLGYTEPGVAALGL